MASPSNLYMGLSPFILCLLPSLSSSQSITNGLRYPLFSLAPPPRAVLALPAAAAAASSPTAVPVAVAVAEFPTATMGRMHSRGKGISSSALPYKRTPHSWVKTAAADVEDMIMKAAKKGQMPSQIGVVLRDQHGIPLVKSVTGSKILRILKAHGLAPEIPEDLYFLIKKAVAIRKHLERNRKDKDSKFRLILVESRIHRLARYYKRTKKLPPTWKYISTALKDGLNQQISQTKMQEMRCNPVPGHSACLTFFMSFPDKDIPSMKMLLHKQ
uniref:Small ribosomal subunit protein uS15 N-terminal domain-containing protein n=1 Tax=Leersia perrieri TaxID=77586 RepID=A0A0D9X3V8_9ORYZ